MVTLLIICVYVCLMTLTMGLCQMSNSSDLFSYTKICSSSRWHSSLLAGIRVGHQSSALVPNTLFQIGDRPFDICRGLWFFFLMLFILPNSVGGYSLYVSFVCLFVCVCVCVCVCLSTGLSFGTLTFDLR